MGSQHEAVAKLNFGKIMRRFLATIRYDTIDITVNFGAVDFQKTFVDFEAAALLFDKFCETS